MENAQVEVMDELDASIQRVCVVGAGPAGCSVLRAFEAARGESAHFPETLVCYEAHSCAGVPHHHTQRRLTRAHALLQQNAKPPG